MFFKQSLLLYSLIHSTENNHTNLEIDIQTKENKRFIQLENYIQIRIVFKIGWTNEPQQETLCLKLRRHIIKKLSIQTKTYIYSQKIHTTRKMFIQAEQIYIIKHIIHTPRKQSYN